MRYRLWDSLCAFRSPRDSTFVDSTNKRCDEGAIESCPCVSVAVSELRSASFVSVIRFPRGIARRNQLRGKEGIRSMLSGHCWWGVAHIGVLIWGMRAIIDRRVTFIDRTLVSLQDHVDLPPGVDPPRGPPPRGPNPQGENAIIRNQGPCPPVRYLCYILHGVLGHPLRCAKALISRAVMEVHPLGLEG